MPSYSFNDDRLFAVPPHPDWQHLVPQHFESIEETLPQAVSNTPERPLGFNDGTIFGTTDFPSNTPNEVISQAAQQQPNPSGAINVIVVLVSFPSTPIAKTTPQYFRDLFFSKNKIPTGSVTEYFTDVTGGKISITGDVEGPYKLPQEMKYYAHGGHGFKGPAAKEPNTQTMAHDTVAAVEKAGISLEKYDNKGRADGYVDAFIIVHAGRGGEDPPVVHGQQKPNVNDIWSVKWVLPDNKPRDVENGKSKTRVNAFLTIPENAKLGVCAHELGHLLFGWPDLYDVSYTPGGNGGIGKWCLMSGGSWGYIGDAVQHGKDIKGTTPCHPSAWCKLQQGWVDISIETAQDHITLNDVKANAYNTTNANSFGSVYKLWSNGQTNSKEYFLIENRTKSGYDASLPGEGLLIWHIDENRLDKNDRSMDNNDTKSHYHVKLMNADGGLIGDGNSANPFPGTEGKREFTANTLPNSKSFAGSDTFVSVRGISDAGRTMRCDIAVTL